MDKNIQTLLERVRESLRSSLKVDLSDLKFPFKYDQNFTQVYITLYQEKNKPIRWGSKQDNLELTLQRIIDKLKTNNNIQYFDLRSCFILFEIVNKEYPCNIRNLTTMRMNSPNRFEPGVNGLKYVYKGITRYFMPTEGYTKSIMSVKQVLNYLSKQCGIAKRTDKISERVHLMRREPIEYTFLESDAYLLDSHNKAYELERGFPIPIDFGKDAVLDKTLKSVDWLVENMNEDGSFLYYYDAYRDSVVDDMHPNMTDPLYNNILRHSGGTISLLRGYELTSKNLFR